MRCVNWKPLKRGAMLGFADLQHDNGLILLGCVLLESNGRRWVNPPGRPQLDADRRVMYGDDGKIAYATVVEFSDKSVRTAWSNAAVAAIGAFEGTTPVPEGEGIESVHDDIPF